MAQDAALGPVFGKKVRRGLKPIFETRVRRTVYPIQSGDSEIELTIDKGKVGAGRQSSPICEVELELKRGESAELFKLARMLAEELHVAVIGIAHFNKTSTWRRTPRSDPCLARRCGAA